MWVKRLPILMVWCAVSPLSAYGAVPPFSPLAKTADYAIEMSDRRTEISRTVTRRGSMIRIDELNRDGATVTYLDLEKPLEVSVSRDNDGTRTGVHIAPVPKPYWDLVYTGVRTGDSGTLLGEKCDVWEISHSRSELIGSSTLSCVTNDGVELWRGFSSRNKVDTIFEAVSLSRRPIRIEEVSPPRGLLDRSAWPLPPAARLAQGSRVVLDWDDPDRPKTRKNGKVHQTTVRFENWTMEDVVFDFGDRNIYLHDSNTRFVLSIDQSSDGALRGLQLWSPSPPRLPRSPRDRWLSPRPTGKSEIVLGEECSWINPFPAIDHGELLCQTRDGVALKERSSAFPHTNRLTAVSVSRPVLAFRDLMPPAAALSPETWGLPG